MGTPQPAGIMADTTGTLFVPGAHDVVWVDGPDTVVFLDGLISQAIEPMPVGSAARSLLLAPQGKLRATLWVLKGADRVGLVADAGRGEVVAGDLTRFKLRVDVEIARDEGPVLDIWGDGAAAAIDQSGLPVPGPRTWVGEPGVIVSSLPFPASDVPRFIVIGRDAASFGAEPAAANDALLVRLGAGEPVMGVDIDEKTIPQEAGVVAGAVDFTKGCYLGQELVARIDSRGRVNRHLRIVEGAGDGMPPEGAEVSAGGRVVGTLSSVAVRVDGGFRAMALLRREVEPGDEVEVSAGSGSIAASIVDIGSG